jgi:hypothetical protein
MIELIQQIAAWGIQALIFIIGLVVVGVLVWLAFWLVVCVVLFPLLWFASLFDSDTPRKPPSE